MVYICQKKAWMTTLFPEDYMKAFDEKFLKQQRKVLLFLDNAGVHFGRSLINEEGNEDLLFPPAVEPEDLFADASVLVTTETQNKKDETVDEDTDAEYNIPNLAPIPSSNQALKAVEVLQPYAVGNGDVDALNSVVDLKAYKAKNKKNTKHTSF